MPATPPITLRTDLHTNEITPPATVEALGAAGGEPVPGPSGVQTSEDFRHILGDMEVPDGVDPSFLAALPEDMRQEVIAEHLR